eukprot:1412049-Rhodomonas_salina.1
MCIRDRSRCGALGWDAVGTTRGRPARVLQRQAVWRGVVVLERQASGSRIARAHRVMVCWCAGVLV